ncbi:MAG: hypothetical protein ACXIT4_00275 [Erythrobacter sp.]
MFRKSRIQPLPIEAPQRTRPGAAVDHIAAATGVPVLVLAVTQLAAPGMAAPITGLEPGAASAILAVQWAALGGLLLIGGIMRMRAVAIFAADFLIITGLSGAIVSLFAQTSLMPVIIHSAIAALGFLSSSFARLTDKADLKRDLRLLREQAKPVPKPEPEPEPEPEQEAAVKDTTL